MSESLLGLNSQKRVSMKNNEKINVVLEVQSGTIGVTEIGEQNG